jgi:hypothetical protein
MKVLDWYFSLKRWKLFSGIIIINILLIFLSQTSLINDVVFFNAYSDQLTWERSMELFSRLKSFFWTAYLAAPLLMLIKFSVLSVVIYIGVFFIDMQQDISLGKIFTVVIASECVFILASMAKLLWFIFFAGNYTIDDISFFYPLALINLFRRSEVAAYWVYPLQTANLFQILYILLLAAGMSRVSQLKRAYTDKIVLMTYVPALTIWIALIMFLSIDSAV